MNWTFANWKTTLTALGIVLFNATEAIYPIVPDKYQPIINGFGAALGLLLAKDFNVTGGNVRQDLSIKSERGR